MSAEPRKPASVSVKKPKNTIPAVPKYVAHVPIDSGTVRGYKGPDSAAREYAGPTKRSADVNDFVTLEAELSKANEREAQKSVLLEMTERRLADLAGEYLALEAALCFSLDDAEAYAAIRDEAQRLKKAAQDASESSGGAIYYSTPVATVEKVRVWRETAVAIADKVVEAIRNGRRPR